MRKPGRCEHSENARKLMITKTTVSICILRALQINLNSANSGTHFTLGTPGIMGKERILGAIGTQEPLRRVGTQGTVGTMGKLEH